MNHKAIAISGVKLEPKANTDQRVSPPEPSRFGNLYFEGRWQSGSAGYSAEVSSPWTWQTIARINVANEPPWTARSSSPSRRRWLGRRSCPGRSHKSSVNAAQVMVARRAEIVDWLVREAGGTHIKAQIEWWAVHNSILEAPTLPGRCTCACVWSQPALALGNSVVVKPAGDTPITGGLLIAKIFEETGLPPGALNVVAGPSSRIGDHFVVHAIPRLLPFTGSTEVGDHAGELSLKSDMMKWTMLELGGNGPPLVTEDVDLEHAVHTAMVGKFLNQGQMCIAINRIIVADAIHDEFVARFVAKTLALKAGGPTDADAAMGRSSIASNSNASRLSSRTRNRKALACYWRSHATDCKCRRAYSTTWPNT